MTNTGYPRLCGGTFMTLVLQALLQRKKAREHYKGESDKLNDPDVLVGLITVINPDYVDPGKTALKTKANDYKSCKLSTGQYLPFGDRLAVGVFDQRVHEDYLSARNDMSNFVSNFLETGTKLGKDIRLVKALIDLVEQDSSIKNEAEFLIGQEGQAVRKDCFKSLDRVCFPSFLLGIWHFIVVNRKNNKIGRETYDAWCPQSGGGTRVYDGHMGEKITKVIEVYTLNLKEDEPTGENDTEEINEQVEENVNGKQDEERCAGTAPNLQQINNPFTFVQYGNNNTQIGYVASQTIIKK